MCFGLNKFALACKCRFADQMRHVSVGLFEHSIVTSFRLTTSIVTKFKSLRSLKGVCCTISDDLSCSFNIRINIILIDYSC